MTKIDSSSTPSSVIKVLVVDNQPTTAESIRQCVIDQPDIEIHICEEATLALAFAAELSPSVILQELIMPDMDSLVLMKFFRAHPCTKSTPIVVLSTKADPASKAAAFASGANDYLVKLPDPIELIARLRYHASTNHSDLTYKSSDSPPVHNKQQNEALDAPTEDQIEAHIKAQVEARTAKLKTAMSELKQTQTQLIRTEKMNSMGQLIDSIAQEVNSPINFIYGNLSHVKDYVNDLLNLVQTYQEQYPTPTPIIHEKLEDLDLEFSSAELLETFVSLRSSAKRIRDSVLSLHNFAHLNDTSVSPDDLPLD
ncbi:MAG: response regulator [Cyanobacteria bacterium J06576_12]